MLPKQIQNTLCIPPVCCPLTSKSKNVFILDLFLTNTQLFNSDFNRWSPVGWSWTIIIFLSTVIELWRHPFTAEVPLVNTLSNPTFLQICFDEETNSLDGQRVITFSANVHFLAKYSFYIEPVHWITSFHYFSLLIIPCMIVYVTNNKEPWTHNLNVASTVLLELNGTDGCLYANTGY